jgi:hypothetical protein
MNKATSRFPDVDDAITTEDDCIDQQIDEQRTNELV